MLLLLTKMDPAVAAETDDAYVHADVCRNRNLLRNAGVPDADVRRDTVLRYVGVYDCDVYVCFLFVYPFYQTSRAYL